MIYHDILIVGGGLSGLSAGVLLAAQFIPVLLVEQKPHLGGRAYSFVDATTGGPAKRGQLLVRYLGYYVSMLPLMRR